MSRLIILTIVLLLAVSSASAGTSAPEALKDLYFGEALYRAFQGDWFDAIARLDTELAQHRYLDEPELDTLYYHIDHAEFAVGDFELAYRMHQRAGRAITAVIEGNVEETVRNEAIFRLARIYFQKDQPVNALYALHEALVMLQEEGIKNAWQRHMNNHLALRAGIEAMGLSFVVEEAHRLPQLNSVTIPEGVDEALVRSRLLTEFNLEIGAGLGTLAGKVWRIGLMGHSSRAENIFLCLGALEAVLSDMGAGIKTGVALEAAQAAMK